MRHVVVDADGEVVPGGALLQLVEGRFDHRGRELFRRQPVAPAADARNLPERAAARHHALADGHPFMRPVVLPIPTFLP